MILLAMNLNLFGTLLLKISVIRTIKICADTWFSIKLDEEACLMYHFICKLKFIKPTIAFNIKKFSIH